AACRAASSSPGVRSTRAVIACTAGVTAPSQRASSHPAFCSMAAAARARPAVQRTRGADQVTDLFAEAGRRFELVTGAREVSSGCGRPGPGLEKVGLVEEV